MKLRNQIKDQTWIIDFEFTGDRQVQINNYKLDTTCTISRVKYGETYGILSCNEKGLIKQLIICSNNKSEAYDVTNPMKREDYANRRRATITY